MEENFNNIKLRIMEYAEKKQISIRKFCEIISFDSSNFYKGNLKSSLNCDVLARIFSAFPDINIEYILLGKGEICAKNKAENMIQDGFSEKIFRELLEKNAELNRRIGRLEAELEHCKKAGAPQAEHATFAVAAGEK